jgi:ABC-2 type transport system ATP-binding protein
MIGAAIETAELTKDIASQFLRKRTRILDSVSLKVNPSETYGLLGLNGAGKTTTLKLLLGLLRPTQGTVTVLGAPAGDRTVLGKVGFLPENPYFYSHLSGRECLDFVGSLFGLATAERRERIHTLLQQVKMVEAADVPMRKYSKGMLQRIGIAQSLLNDPEVIFWDEPMSGLDIIGRRDVRQILHELKAKGRTIFFNSHLLPDVNEVCDRVGVLHKGRLIAERKIENISQSGSYKDLEEYFLQAIGEGGGQS